MKCKVEFDRFIFEVRSSSEWRKGNPINPKVPKYLVKVIDKFTHDEFYPRDHEFSLLLHQMSEDEIIFLSDLIRFKERHNRSNLKNPETRHIENDIHKLAEQNRVRFQNGERMK